MIRYLPLLAALLWINAAGQPAGYYDTAQGLAGSELKQALHEIIKDHTIRTYAQLWQDLQATDARGDGTVWDIYSDIPGGIPAYTFQFITDQCGNYAAEGDCYNREHSFPKSWFGGEIEPMYTDLYHIYPTDGYVNNRRGNLPYGETNNPTWTSTNGSMAGASSVEGYGGSVFEPLDEYKGDLARGYFYMAVRYLGEDGSWPGSEMTDGAEPLPWALKMLISWSENDPVSQKEYERNNSVYTIQGNRNPFIDNPSWVNDIWAVTSSLGRNIKTREIRIWPNPASDLLNIQVETEPGQECSFSIFDISGQLLMRDVIEANSQAVDISGLSPGIYTLSVKKGNLEEHRLFVVTR